MVVVPVGTQEAVGAAYGDHVGLFPQRMMHLCPQELGLLVGLWDVLRMAWMWILLKH